MKKTLRSVGAALAAIFVVVVLSIATDLALYTTGVYPPPDQPLDDARCLLATAYRTLYGVLGGYIVARLAPDRPLRHAMAIGTLGLVVSIVGVVTSWGRGLGPTWYPLALVALAVPQSWAGAKLRIRQERGARP